MGQEQFAAVAEFAPIIRAAFGGGRRFAAVRRLRGGSKKGVHRLDFDGGTAVIGYVWNQAENYLASAPRPASGEQSGPFWETTGSPRTFRQSQGRCGWPTPLPRTRLHGGRSPRGTPSGRSVTFSRRRAG
jgi:hypothetical protein